MVRLIRSTGIRDILMLADRFNFEAFVSERVGFGRHQLLMVLSLIFVEIADGVQAVTSRNPLS
jgi:hypothetical protein